MFYHILHLHSSGRHSEVMMTPEDFLRSITPGMQQPEHLGLDQGSNSKIENSGLNFWHEKHLRIHFDSVTVTEDICIHFMKLIVGASSHNLGIFSSTTKSQNVLY